MNTVVFWASIELGWETGGDDIEEICSGTHDVY